MDSIIILEFLPIECEKGKQYGFNSAGNVKITIIKNSDEK